MTRIGLSLVALACATIMTFHAFAFRRITAPFSANNLVAANIQNYVIALGFAGSQLES